MAKIKKFAFITLILTCMILGTTFYIHSSKNSPYLSVVGPVKMADGIGRQAVYFIDTLYDVVTIQYCPTRGYVDLTDVPSRIKPLLHENRNKKAVGKVIVYQDSLDSFPTSERRGSRYLRKLGALKENQIRIAYSMSESSRIPASCASFLNKKFDAVAVPDDYLIEVYRLSGVTIPIFVVPLGLDLDLLLQQPLKKTGNCPFCFINTSSLISRKNHEGLIRAFHQAFGNNPDVQLHMNYRYAIGDLLEKNLALIKSLNCDNIVLSSIPLDAKNYVSFLSHGDVFVSLSKGEGFSIQPREAMALGLPVIISDNTAHKTILKSSLACGISCPQQVISYNSFLKSHVGEEYIPDTNEAAHAMRYIYDHYKESLQEAENRRAWAKQYRYQDLTALYLNLVKPKTVTLGTKDEITENGLTTSSQALYEKYLKVLSE
jgi:glycosyltransferase involved in cell wall biosynthesis